jgi:heptosyltransferase-2
MHQVDSYKRLLEPLGIPRSLTLPRLIVSHPLPKTGLIGINPGAAYGSAKCWPADRFRALALKLVEHGFQVVFFGDASTRDLANHLPVQNLAGTTTLTELARHIQACALLVTNDSGPMHMASALGTKVVALFGSTDPNATGPSGNATILNKKVACSPCFQRTCPIDFRCMTQITVDDVFSAILKRLAC